MENLNSKNVVEMLTKGGISAVLLIIILYFGGAFMNSMQEMQKDLASIRIEIAKVQVKILTP